MKKSVLIVAILLVLLAGIVFQDWRQFGSKVSEGTVINGPGIVMVSPQEDIFFVLNEGEKFEGKGEEIFFSRLGEEDLKGWEIIILPE